MTSFDWNYCTMLKTGKCGVCSKVCTAGAIDYTQKDEYITEDYGAIVAATGYNPIKYAYTVTKLQQEPCRCR